MSATGTSAPKRAICPLLVRTEQDSPFYEIFVRFEGIQGSAR
jgi:hypothetical protein